MADKILYTNKEKLLDDITIPDKNKVTANDMNEIKEVVNAHADDIDELDEVKANRTEIPTDLSELSNENTKFVNETQLSEAIESEESAREEADENIQGQIDSINDDISALDDRVETNEDDIADINLEQTVQDNEIGALKLDSGHTIELSINTTSYELSAKLKNKTGTVLNTSTIDLPLETMIINVEYDNANKQLIITLQNGNKIYVPIADIIGGLQSEITSENMLSSDLVDDNNHAHKFMSISEKTKLEDIETGAEVNVIEVIKVDGTAITVTDKTINIDLSAKEDKSNKITSISSSSTDTQYPTAKAVYDSQVEQDNEISVLRNTVESELEDATATGTSITVNDSANAPAKLLPSGNTYQATNIKTYECEGTESGDYYFTYNNVNYQFTMPTIETGSILAFNTDTLKLYLGDTEITTTTDNTGTLITLEDTPNPKYEQPIHVVKGENTIVVRTVENLLRPEYFYPTTASGLNSIKELVEANDDFYMFSGNPNNQLSYCIVFPCKPNTDYVFKVDKIIGYDNQDNIISDSIGWYVPNSNPFKTYEFADITFQSQTYTKYVSSRTNALQYTSESGKYIKFKTNADQTECCLGFQGNAANKIKMIKPMLYEGENINIPYYGESFTLTLPEGMEMCKIGDYADTFEKRDEKWYKRKIILRMQLLSTANWVKVATYDNTILFGYTTNLKAIGLYNIISNKFKTYAGNRNEESILGQSAGRNVQLQVFKTRASSVEELRTFLANNEVQINYQLENPILEEITDTTLISQLDQMQKILSYYGGTNITTISAGDLNPILNFEYKKSNRLRIEALENAIISLGGNI